MRNGIGEKWGSRTSGIAAVESKEVGDLESVVCLTWLKNNGLRMNVVDRHK